LPNKHFTVLVVPDRSSRVRRFQVPKAFLVRIGVGAGLFLLVTIAASIHYLSVVGQVAENELLREENLTLRGQLKVVQEKVSNLSATVDRVERFDKKLRAVTFLSDPQRHLAMGPVSPRAVDPEDRDSPSARVMLEIDNPKALHGKLDSLSAQATHEEQSLQELNQYFDDRKSLLASTPSVWPTRGWVTSEFNYRLDPFTGERTFHKGLDIATAHGAPVSAPADAVVIFTGAEGGYGKVVVLDHGYSIKSRYGHLAEILVKVGDKVKRGQLIATVGNTGRTTGPHLHYEVRVAGIPENPQKFILE
jgi:murein DD-endopeptidase MepM/ murein hydrolase activator NlpD